MGSIRKAGRQEEDPQQALFLLSLFEIPHFEQDCVLRIQGIELALCEGLGDAEY
jgi:hypothetical protein